MKIMRRLTGVLVPAIMAGAIGALAPVACRADPSLPVTFNNQRDGFSISFPSGWAPMAASKLEDANKTAEIEHPDWKRPALHYGYEMTNAAGLSFVPSAIIRIAEMATPPDPKAVQDELEKGGELPQAVQSIQRQKPEFHAELNAFVQKNRLEVAGVSPIGVYVACFLTRDSVIKMIFYTPLADNGDPSVPIQDIINSVQIAAEKKIGPPTPRSYTGLIVAILSIVVLVIVLVRAKPHGEANSPA
jgi:hypothetical protein